MFNGRHSGFIVTGSLALAVQGLVDESTIKDIDLILLNPDDCLLAILRGLAEANKKEYKYIPPGEVPFTFEFRGVSVDVWVKYPAGNLGPVDYCAHTNPDYPGLVVYEFEKFHYTTVEWVIKAKGQMNRQKDYKDLQTIIHRLIDLLHIK